MSSLYKQFRDFHVLKKFKKLFSECWNIDLFLIEKSSRGFFYSSETELGNPILKALLNSGVFREDFVRAVSSLKNREGLMSGRAYTVLWEKTGLNIFAVPLAVNQSLEGFVVCAGFKNNNEKRLTEILSYLNFSEEWTENQLSHLKAVTVMEREYIKKLLSLLAEESFLLFQKQQNDRRLIQSLRGRALLDKYEDMIGKSPNMQFLFGVLKKIRRSESPILIQGENGTGKELIARAIHRESPRAAMPFIAQNCSAFNDNLLESELFGHKKGSFSGAVCDKKGLFDTAHKGTLFLDEVGDASPAIQAKLLRVLQEGTFVPVGDTRERRSDTRIIAATNKDLQEMIAKGAFREDLFYRLNVIAVRPPALRDRLEDIPLLVKHFIDRKAFGQKKRLSKEAMDALCAYHWPGNVRELQNEIERLLVLSDEDQPLISAENLSPKIKVGKRTAGLVSFQNLTLKEAVKNLEKKLIADHLRKQRGNRTKAAKSLGISRTSILMKIKEYNFEQEDYDEAS